MSKYAEKMTKESPSEGDLKVWHIPQVPGKSFQVSVKDYAEAEKVMETLAFYDLFQLEEKVKPDFANVQGVSIFEDGDWSNYDPEDYDV